MSAGTRVLAHRARWAAQALKQHRWVGLGVAWGLAIVGAAAVAWVPQRYEASARLYVDTQTVLKPMMVGLTFQPDVEQQMRMLARTLISRPNIERLVDQPDSQMRFATPAERDKTVTRLMEQIKIVAAERSNLYTISYRDSDRGLALRLVKGTVALFVDSGSAGKKQDSAEARRFIDEQIRTNEVKLSEAENRLKEFKIKNFGVTGVSNQDYFARMSTQADEVGKLRSDLMAAERARDSFRRELAAEDPRLPAESFPAAAVPTVLEIDNRIESQRKQLDDLTRRFTEDHPDVINARRLVARLEEQRRQELSARALDASRKPSGTAATSPVYQKLRISLADSEAQVASLRAQLGAQQGRLDQTRSLAGRLPQVEAELVQLNRDYDVIRKNYDQLVARRESALLAVKLDESSQLEDFRVVEPPRVASTPVFPGTKHLALMALALAFVGGGAAALAADWLRPTLNGTQALEQLSGRPVLGRIARSRTDAYTVSVRREFRRFAGASALLVMAQLIWLVWLVARPVSS
jgi:polysaccharide chain length determinant protein (PEP-CTERM system associated)